MKTIRTLVELSSDYLLKKGVESSRREAEDLLAFCMGVKRLDLYLDYDRPVEPREVDVFRSFIEKRSKRMPFAYITKEVSFFDLTLQVNEDVLIPRSETEVCLDQIFKAYDFSKKTVWDIATGSGCIGLSCKSRFPSAQVVLSDICPKALQVAENNKESNALNVECRLGDLLEPFHSELADVVFVNPPYISEQDFSKLEPEVKCYEPKKALVADGEGLAFYKELALQLPMFLRQNAHVFLEIGFDQKESVRDIFSSRCWKSMSYVKDFGGVDRFISLEFSQNL